VGFVDDDISGFFDGWFSELVHILKDKSVIAVSPRLIAPGGRFGTMAGMSEKPSTGIVNAEIIPGACVFCRTNEALIFDERFLGGGSYEDTFWCQQMKKKFPRKRFVVTNNTKLIHANERKNQTDFWEKNRAVYKILTRGKGNE